MGFVDSCQVTHPRVEEISSAQKDLARKVERFQAFWELMWGDPSENFGGLRFLCLKPSRTKDVASLKLLKSVKILKGFGSIKNQSSVVLNAC